MSEKQKGAVIITHLQQEGSSMFGSIVQDRGLRLKTMNSSRYGLSGFDPLRPDLLIVMGGPIGVYQADDYPFLHDEIAILKERIKNDLPTIGICLGSQLIAAALGEKVYPGSQGKEVGWNPLNLTEAGQDSEAEILCGSKTNMFHWHGDTFELPKGAELLASTDLYQNQIFKYGNNILGVQCHPEVQKDQLGEWFVMFHRDITGDNPLIPIEELRKQTDEHIETLNTNAKLFFNHWLEQRGL